jgi:TonB family protein
VSKPKEIPSHPRPNICDPFSFRHAQKKSEHQAKIVCYPSPHPKLVLQVRPKYPQEAKRAGIEGRVSLHLIVGVDGSVHKIEVIRGAEPFLQAAKTAVAQWKCQAVVLEGVAVESDATVDIIFKISEQKPNKTDSPIAKSSPHD